MGSAAAAVSAPTAAADAGKVRHPAKSGVSRGKTPRRGILHMKRVPSFGRLILEVDGGVQAVFGAKAILYKNIIVEILNIDD